MKITGQETPEFILKELGKRVRQYRIATNISQAQLAKQCGISIGAENRLETGESAKISTLISVMSSLGIAGNLDALIPDIPPNNMPQRKKIRTLR